MNNVFKGTGTFTGGTTLYSMPNPSSQLLLPWELVSCLTVQTSSGDISLFSWVWKFIWLATASDWLIRTEKLHNHTNK